MVFALSTFWQVFIILIVWIPLILMWVFALAELFKHRESFRGWEIALWLIGILFFPIVGAAAYLTYQGMRSQTMDDAAEYQAGLADDRKANPNVDR